MNNKTQVMIFTFFSVGTEGGNLGELDEGRKNQERK